MAMDLRQLRYFVAVAETGSFSAAAASLRIAQSALSRQVQSLEEACRGALMERGARGVVLTEAGALLLTRARFLLAEAASTISEISELNNEPSGMVRLAAPPSFGDILFPPLAVGVVTRLPGVQLELREELNDTALVALRQGELDLAVVSAPDPDPRIDYIPLCTEPMILVGPPGDVRLAVESVPVEMLPDLPLILPIGSGWLSVVRRRLGTRAGFAQLKARVRVQSPGPMKAMLRAGLGYAVLPASSVQQDLTEGTLSGATVRDFVLSRVLAVPHDRPITRAARAVAEAIQAETAAIVEAGHYGWHKPENERRRRSYGVPGSPRSHQMPV
jgi:LysR family transcriptional regulator, nitrogen assimilation regulatory protein